MNGNAHKRDFWDTKPKKTEEMKDLQNKVDERPRIRISIEASLQRVECELAGLQRLHDMSAAMSMPQR